MIDPINVLEFELEASVMGRHFLTKQPIAMVSQQRQRVPEKVDK
jgi:hypothetical protein